MRTWRDSSWFSAALPSGAGAGSWLLLLLAILMFSWFANIKQLALDWVKAAEEQITGDTPNILLIVADDLGYNDTSAINSTGLGTPNLKLLAEQGVTFTRHYADSTCTPSRVGMLTGRYPERSGFRPIGYEIPADYPTLAEKLKAAGYVTYLTGKWHAGEEREAAWPQNKGFDQWFGFLNQWETAGEATAIGKGARQPTYRNPMLRKNGGELKRTKGHLTDILTDHTIATLKRFRKQRQPWFLYHAFLAPHHPIQPADRYSKKYPDTPEGQYSALVEQLDDAVGRILDAVDRQNTLVVFLSDNGGTNKQRDNNFPFFGRKGDPYEGAYRTPLIISWPAVVPENKLIHDIVMNVDIYPTLASSAKVDAGADLNGENLWPLILHDIPTGERSRSWETYSHNVNAVNYSFLSTSGNWRLSTPQGAARELYDLRLDPPGNKNVADLNPSETEMLSENFWQSHWRNSLLPVSSVPGESGHQRLYRGFDAMRTPAHNGFTIGLELGPVDQPLNETSFTVLAGQAGVWELRYEQGSGLAWHIGNEVLKESKFDPNRCNPVILTGYFEEAGHLSVRAPFSELKLYSHGALQDLARDVSHTPADDESLLQPTFVNFGGRALFSNMMLNSWSDPYSPRVVPQFKDFYESAHRDKLLAQPDVALMNDHLCKTSG